MLSEKDKFWLWFSRLDKISYAKRRILIEKFKNPKKIWDLKKEELISIDSIGIKEANILLDFKYREDLEKYIDYMNKNNIGFIEIYNKNYPNKLKEIYDPPFVLFYKGDISIINDKAIAMIGCREYSNYGKKVALELGEKISNLGLNIISGLARGIDTFSHIGCLKGKSKTIAILGTGLDLIYPEENKKVFEEIIESGGLILTEYIIGTPIKKMNFPMRNRIISGLSDGVLVIEAKKKSGTMITVEFALEQGKNVYAVPGRINELNSLGTNNMIKEGAKIVCEVNDVLEDFLIQ